MVKSSLPVVSSDANSTAAIAKNSFISQRNQSTRLLKNYFTTFSWFGELCPDKPQWAGNVLIRTVLNDFFWQNNY